MDNLDSDSRNGFQLGAAAPTCNPAAKMSADMLARSFAIQSRDVKIGALTDGTGP